MKKSIVLSLQIMILFCIVSVCWSNSTQILSIDFESEDISSWIRQDMLQISEATWTHTDDGYNGTRGLHANTTYSWSGVPDISFLINSESIIKSEGKYTITAKVKNTGYENYNQPNGIVFSSSMDNRSGYLAILEYNALLTIHRYDSSGYHAIIDRAPISTVQTNVWYNWVISYDPTHAFTKFEVYGWMES